MKSILLNKKIMVIISSIFLLICIILTTYSFYGWKSEDDSNVQLIIPNIAKIIWESSPNANFNLTPVLNYTEGGKISFRLNKLLDEELIINIKFKITSITDNLKHEQVKWVLAKSYDGVNYTPYLDGTFLETYNEQMMYLSMNELTLKGITYYTFFVYIDGTMQNPISLQEGMITGEIFIEQTDNTPHVNIPNLKDGMIPIKYNGSDWVKANLSNTSSDWYDYESKKWANVVLVTEEKRTTYKNAAVDTVINEEDILGYLVWIPRYKYKLFNSTYQSINPKEIEIEFEQGTSSTGTVSCSTSNLGVETCNNKTDGAWYTHPAFTFGDNELTGIWVGKFETTGTDTLPTIKPSVIPLTNQSIYNQFITSQKFVSTTYLNDTADAHMMKNIEWGALLYLTQSKYGLCTDATCFEIGINNYYNENMKTGCGDRARMSQNTICNDYKTTNGQFASTTRNIYGVFDTSGGAWEYTMSVMADTFGNPTYSASDFTSLNIPNSKYYDKYQYGETDSDQTAYNRSHLGDGTGEVRGWYNDTGIVIFPYLPTWVSTWSARSGAYYEDVLAGNCVFSYNTGEKITVIGFRTVIN